MMIIMEVKMISNKDKRMFMLLFIFIIFNVILYNVYAVEVEGQAQPPIQQAGGIITEILNFFVRYWVLMLFFGILFTIGIIIYYFFKKSEDWIRERDEPGFLVYNNAIKSCKQQAKKTKIKKRYSLVNLLWG